MQTAFHKTIERAFREVAARYGFRVIPGGYDAAAFGNSLVVLESGDYSMRIVRDRGQVFVEIASPLDPGNWYGLGKVLAVVHGNTEDEVQYSGPINPDDAASVIERHHAHFVERLGPECYERTRVQLDQIGQSAKERLLGQSQPGR